MFIGIRDCKNSRKDRQWIRGVYGEYLDALSDLDTGLLPVIGARQIRQDELFANWFSNDRSHPLLITKGPEAVGFALVTRPRHYPPTSSGVDYHMTEFFVRGAYRRGGIGRNAARLIFDRFAGEWEIVEYLRNPGAVAFWRRVLGDYSRGRFSERSRNGEIRQRFSSGAAAAR